MRSCWSSGGLCIDGLYVNGSVFSRVITSDTVLTRTLQDKGKRSPQWKIASFASAGAHQGLVYLTFSQNREGHIKNMNGVTSPCFFCIRNINSSAEIIRTDYSKVPAKKLINIGACDLNKV